MKKTTKPTIIYIRYALPVVMAAVLLVLMLLPAYRFKDADGLKSAVSLFELYGNSWDTVREYIFGNKQVQAPTMDFAKTVMTLIIVLWVLFVVGLASAIYALVSALRAFRDGAQTGKTVLFVTLTFNRVSLCALHGLMLPVFLLPTLLPVLYRGILAYEVTAIYTPFNLIFAALVVFVAVCVLVAVSKKYEMLLGMNIYAVRRQAPLAEEPQVEEEEEDGESDDPYTLMSERSRAEQAERIRKLLIKHEDEEEDK